MAQLDPVLVGMRQVALGHACHDLRGDKSAEETVARAASYFAFLTGEHDQKYDPPAALRERLSQA